MIKYRRMRWTGHVCRREINIKLDLREMGLGGVYLIHLTQDRDQWKALVNTLMNL
jgi:hypothetical protein